MKQDPDQTKPDQPTGKYYVQSAEVQWLVMAQDPGCAALRLVQKTMEPAVKSRQKITSGLKMVDHLEVERLLQPLGHEILVSESGFGSRDAGVFVTEEVMECWSRQMTAIEKLLRKLA